MTSLELVLHRLVAAAVALSSGFAPTRAVPTPPRPADAPADTTSPRRTDADSLVVWDSVRVVASPQERRVSASMSCVGVGAGRSCGPTLALLFDSLAVRLDGDGPLAASRSVTLDIPLTLRRSAGALHATHDLRFHVSKRPAARVALVIDAAGVTTVYDFPRGRATEGERTRRITRAFPTGVCRSRADASCRRVERVTLLLLADRATTGDVASLTVDSDDAAVVHTARR